MHKDFEFKSGLMINIWEELSQFFHLRKYNWCTLHFLNFSFEYDRHLGGLELMLIVLGLGIRISYPIQTDISEKTRTELRRCMGKVKSGIDGWVLEKELKAFKEKKREMLPVSRTRERARYFAKKYGTPVRKIYFYITRGR